MCVCVCACVCVCVCDVIKMAARKPRGHEATRSLEKTSNSFAFASLDLRSSVPPYHHTPWGLSSWQSDRSTLTASSGYGDRSTWRALTAYFTAMAPSCHSPQGFQAWAWPAHPYNSFLAYETRPRLLPGSCPTPLLGQGDWRREEVCVCVRVCVCVCACVFVPTWTDVTALLCPRRNLTQVPVDTSHWYKHPSLHKQRNSRRAHTTSCSPPLYSRCTPHTQTHTL